MRPILPVVVGLLAWGGTACAGSPQSPAPPPPAASASRNVVPGEYLVTLAPPADPAVLREAFGELGIARTQDLGDGVHLVALEKDPGLARMLEIQGKDPRIRALQPNYRYRAR